MTFLFLELKQLVEPFLPSFGERVPDEAYVI